MKTTKFIDIRGGIYLINFNPSFFIILLQYFQDRSMYVNNENSQRAFKFYIIFIIVKLATQELAQLCRLTPEIIITSS